MFVGKWWTFSASAALELTTGFTAAFSLYASAVRIEFRYSQNQLQGIGSALITAGFLAIIPGLIYDRLKHRYRAGPRSDFKFASLHHIASEAVVCLKGRNSLI